MTDRVKYNGAFTSLKRIESKELEIVIVNKIESIKFRHVKCKHFLTTKRNIRLFQLYSPTT